MSAAKIINRFPNQRITRIHHVAHDRKHLYYNASIEATNKAMAELSGNAFKLYIYLNKNQDGFNVALSHKAIKEQCNMAKQTYLNAFDELIEHGYVKLLEGTKAIYDFYENPDDMKIEKKTKEKKAVVSKNAAKNEVSDDAFKDYMPPVDLSFLDSASKDKSEDKPEEIEADDTELPFSKV